MANRENFLPVALISQIAKMLYDSIQKLYINIFAIPATKYLVFKYCANLFDDTSACGVLEGIIRPVISASGLTCLYIYV